MSNPALQYVNSRIHPEKLKQFCIEALQAAGLSSDHAEQTADVLVTTDAWGTFSHGSRQLVPLLNNLRKGGLKADAQPEIVDQGSGFVVVDGHFAMPMVTSRLAMQAAIDKARSAGIAYAAVRRSGHYGAAGYYAVMAAEQDMIGLSMTNVDVCMTVPGARAPVIGTNPLAYAVPAGTERTVFLDIATSVVAISKVIAAKTAGKPIPEGWLVDELGRPTTDTSTYPDKGAILPMAGHKGYGVALLIEILAGVLTGASFLSGIKPWLVPDPQPADEGHAFVAVNIESLIPIDTFKARMDAMIGEVRSAPKAEGSDRIYLPGEMEWERFDLAHKNGIQLPDYVLINLFSVAEQTGLTDRLIAMLEEE
ncbi:MAG: Ldh family oxidoreductase [Spirochaetaceae bacterium]|nr:MAG: Ldh family oxidoreductase [Spirochaetaceae bacterium]